MNAWKPEDFMMLLIILAFFGGPVILAICVGIALIIEALRGENINLSEKEEEE